MNLNEYAKSHPIRLFDPDGPVTFEQINHIAKQMGIE